MQKLYLSKLFFWGEDLNSKDVREDIKATLKVFGLRPTKARILVCEVLMKAGCPVSHGELQADERLKEINRVTLYRTLNALEGAGLVHKVPGVDSCWYFCLHETNQSGCPGDHPHFYCLECGRMECLKEHRLPFIEVPCGYHVEGKQLLVYGICSKCQNNFS